MLFSISEELRILGKCSLHLNKSTNELIRLFITIQYEFTTRNYFISYARINDIIITLNECRRFYKSCKNQRYNNNFE
jgi:hypothetical protein